jgi:hypothetical protein
MGEFDGLAQKCESAARPDRSLDWEIHCREGIGGVGMYGDHPRYTESADAAMTLVPKGYTTAGFYGDRFYLIANGDSWGCVIQMAEGVGHWSEIWRDSAAKGCKSAALAICAAALRSYRALNPSQT